VQNENWQRIHNWWGYSPWDVGIERPKKKKTTETFTGI